MRRLILAGLATLAVSLALFMPSGRESSASHVNPILFVHGYTSNAAAWDTMKARFLADGWESGYLNAYTFSSSVSNATVAQDVANRVNEIKAATGAAKVDIITHSMGGLSSRYYLKNLSGTANVDDWVSLGGPNHGTTLAFLCFTTPCREMRPGSTFLKNLNSGDETPGAVNYGTWWSPCDEAINPDDSTILSGATNTQTSCISHSDLRTNLTVYQQVKAFVQ